MRSSGYTGTERVYEGICGMGRWMRIRGGGYEAQIGGTRGSDRRHKRVR